MCMLQGVTMLQVEAMPMMRLLEIFRLEADGIEHGAGGGAFGAVEHDAGMRGGVDLVDLDFFIARKSCQKKRRAASRWVVFRS